MLCRFNAVHVYAEKVGFLSVQTVYATIQRIPSLVAVVGNYTIQPTEIQFATAQPDSIPFLMFKTTALLFSLKVSPKCFLIKNNFGILTKNDLEIEIEI